MPAMHANPAPPTPHVPMLQLQACAHEAPAEGAAGFVGQGTHVEFARVPTAAEYVPAEQLLHATDPTAVLNLPAAHAVQFPVPTSPP